MMERGRELPSRRCSCLWTAPGGPCSPSLDDRTLPSAPNTCITLEFLLFGRGSSVLCLRMAHLQLHLCSASPSQPRTWEKPLPSAPAQKVLSTWSLQHLGGGRVSCKVMG